MTGLPALRAWARRGGLLGCVWLALAGAEAEALVVGALAVPAATALSLALLPPRSPVRLARAAAAAPGFLARSVVGGLDVAWRAFHPRLPLRPGWIEMPTGLPDGARVALGIELSLMPGTLAAGTRDGRLLVHLLDRDGASADDVRAEEARLARMIAQGDAA